MEVLSAGIAAATLHIGNFAFKQMSLSDDIQVIFTLLKQFLGGLGVSSEKPASEGVGKFQVPIRGEWHNSGGFDPSGKGSVGRKHFGVDFRSSGGSSVVPIAAGVVKYVRPDPLGGNTLVIDHENGYTSYYAHLGTINVMPGDRVGTNSEIATVGASGNAKGFPHCHLQVWHNNNLIDPAAVISIPPYTPFNPQKENLWISGEAKEKAANWNLAAYLAQSKNKRVV
jgi:murein DD-endopeptidase MepM/ murein hydrolase activator NlpD